MSGSIRSEGAALFTLIASFVLTLAGCTHCAAFSDSESEESVPEIETPAPPELDGATDVAVNKVFACALAHDEVWCWGAYPSATDTTPLATRVPGLAHPIAIAAGAATTCAWSETEAWCWGLSIGACSGATPPAQCWTAPPRPVGLAAAPRDVQLRGNRACALDVDGRLACWGFEIGAPITDATPEPGVVQMFGAPAPRANHTSTEPLAIAEHVDTFVLGGDYLCYARGEDVVCDAPLLDTQTVYEIAPPDRFAETLGPRGRAACRIAASGRGVECVGDNAVGAFGTDDDARWSEPRALPGLESATALALGIDHACAILDGGRLACWGLFALPDHLGETARVTIDGLADVVQVDAGARTTCARLADGRVRCFGINLHGLAGASAEPGHDLPIVVDVTTVRRAP